MSWIRPTAVAVLIAGQAVSLLAADTTPTLLNVPDPSAVADVLAGRRPVANAAWWGFNREDATVSLQAALDSGARVVVIPFMGAPWIIRPVRLPSNQEVRLEPGVVVLAKAGEFRGPGDSLFTATGQSNLVMRGYGATLRMRKRDYQRPPYTKAEWRMGIALRGCRGVLLEGLRVESSGGDGFYVDGGGALGWSQDVTIRDCVASDNHRQGLSVISAVDLLVENCLFAPTWGTAPEAGIDLEPDTASQRLVRCLIRNCRFENNNGNQILVHLDQLSRQSEPVSIRFEDCLARQVTAGSGPESPGPPGGLRGVAGIAVGDVKDDGPAGLIEFDRCVTDTTGKEGARLYDKSAARARVRFVNCSFRHPWAAPSPGDHGPRAPLLLQSRKTTRTREVGGVDFVACQVFDTVDRAVFCFAAGANHCALRDVQGRLLVTSPAAAPRLQLGPNPQAVHLDLVAGVFPPP